MESLRSPEVLTIPTPEDKLILTVDAGLGATLYVSRDDKRLVAECFSLKLKSHQIASLVYRHLQSCGEVNFLHPLVYQHSAQHSVSTV